MVRTCAERNSEILGSLPPVMCYSIHSGRGRGPCQARREHVMLQYTIEDTNTGDNYGPMDESEVLGFVRGLFDADALEESGMAFPETLGELFDAEALLGIAIY